MARWLVDELADPSDIDVHRYEAGEGLVALAPSLAPATASSVLDRLRSRADRITEPSAITELQSDPNPHFARVKMRTPRASDRARAVALTAECELAARSGRLGEVGPDVARALNDEEDVVRAAALRVAHHWPGVADVDFAAFMTDDAPEVRTVALSACAEHGGLDHEAERLAELCRPDHPLALRCAVLGIAREKVDVHRRHLEQLARDPHVYVRAAAHHALGER